MMRFAALLCSTLIVASQVMGQSVLHVPAHYPSIQEAIDASSSGDTVRVADGNWTGFVVDKPLTVESVNGSANSVINGRAPRTGPSAFIIVDAPGVTIRGLALRLPQNEGLARALVVNADDFTATDCTIEQFRNTWDGAAVWIAGNGFVLSNCIIRDNNSGAPGLFAPEGAGITVNGSGRIEGCIIENNHTVDGQGDPAANMHDAGSGPGLIIGGGNVTVRDSIIRNNRAGDGGSMVSCLSMSSNGTSGGEGAGVYIGGGNVTFINTLIASNRAGSGGAGTVCPHGSPIVNGGDGGSGGGVFIRDAAASFINCTIVDNAAGAGGPGSQSGEYGSNGRGGGIHARNATVTIHNTILWGNTAPGLDLFDAQLASTGAQSVLTRSCVEGLPGTFDQNGNFALDPGFVDVAGAAPDYRLRENSPCIDAGDNTKVPTWVETDLGGEPRFHEDPESVNVGVGSGALVDVGAHEFQGVSCYANCTGSTSAPLLTVDDFICFIDRFASGDPRANCDGSTSAPLLTVDDFICYINRFAAGCP